ncbi:hypothetical protein ACFQV2_28125 [Actinokineospora soli]|uniref:Uncharacterized protein n=1 Tax=Actinokineospora soli TaxID=1048753 RepID=A0ABW2TU67_9PSEU
MYAAAAMAIFPLLPEETRVEAWDLKYGRVLSADAFLSYYQVVGTTVLFLVVAAVVGFAVRFVARVLYPVLFTAVFGVVAVPRWVGSGVVSVVLGGVVRVLAVVPRTSVRWVALGAILVGFHFDLLTS